METTGSTNARIEGWNRVRARVGLEPVSGTAQPESLQVDVESQTASRPGRRLPLPNIGGAVRGVGSRVGGWFRGKDIQSLAERTQPAERKEIVQGATEDDGTMAASAEPEQTITEPRGRGRLGNLVVEAVRTGFRRWWENVDPRTVAQHFKERDWIWLAGFGTGIAETVAVSALPPVLNTYARAGINFAVISGGHLALNIARGAMEAKARRAFEGEELITRQEKIAERFGEGHERLKKFGLGLSAGVTYTSLGVVAFYPMEGFETGVPEEAPKAPQPAPPSAPSVEVPPQVPPSEAVFPPAAEQTVIEERIIKLSASPDWQTQVSAEVGTQLKITDGIINQSLQNMGKSLSDLDPVSLEKARLALQHALETQANTSFNGAMETVVNANTDADLSTAVEKGQNAFREAISSSDTLKELAEISQKAIEDQLKIEDVLANQVTSQLNADPSLFTEQVISRGTTVGHILQESGYNITWGPQDAKVFGTHIAANYDLLTNMWERMADARLIPQDVFPVSMSELSDLVDKAELGDVEALRKLKQALHWITAGSKFRILNQEALIKALGLIK